MVHQIEKTNKSELLPRKIDWEQPITEQLAAWAEHIKEQLEKNSVEQAVDELNDLHQVDRAEVIHALDQKVRSNLFENLNNKVIAEVLDELDPDDANEIVADIDLERLAHILEITPPDTAVDILRGMEWNDAHALLINMKSSRILGDLFSYEDEEAGGVMTPEVVALRESWNVAHAINFLRSSTTHPEHVRQLFVVDKNRKLTGWVELSELIFASPATRLHEIMHTDVSAVLPDDDQAKVVAIAQRYNLLSVPVISASGELRGAISADDIQRITEEQTTEEFLRIASSGKSDSYNRPLRNIAIVRLPWLIINIFAAAIVGIGISFFESSIASFAVLASHLAMVMSQAAVVGNQVNIVTIRSIATGDISYHNALKLLLREYTIALVNGTLVAGVMAGVVGLWRGDFYLALVIFIATFVSYFVAVAAGALIPLAMQRFRVDPAVSSGTVLGTITDLASSLVYLGLATLLLSLLID